MLNVFLTVGHILKSWKNTVSAIAADSFIPHLLCAYFVPGPLLSAGDKMINSTWSPPCNSAHMQAHPYVVFRDKRLCLRSVFLNHKDAFQILMFDPMTLIFLQLMLSCLSPLRFADIFAFLPTRGTLFPGS